VRATVDAPTTEESEGHTRALLPLLLLPEPSEPLFLPFLFLLPLSLPLPPLLGVGVGGGGAAGGLDGSC
jgi:hypothetical protein